jgi:hypothetical protein
MGQESREPLSKRRCGRAKKLRKLQTPCQEGLVLKRPMLERRSKVAEITYRRPTYKINILCQSKSLPYFAIDCELLKMLSPIILPPTFILESAGYLVVDWELMLVVNILL